MGTGMLRMQRWLLDLRAAIGNSSVACILDEAKRMCVVSSSGALPASASASAPQAGGGTSEVAGAGAPAGTPAVRQLAGALKGTLGASLVLHKAPFRVTFEAGRAQRLESSTFMVKKWLFSGECCSWGRQAAGWLARSPCELFSVRSQTW
jgi:hypothetical protein